MTATFGKLEHQTLTLQPGLNIIHAPNEWGKSTWCAFLAAMLYGIETRTHSTKNALADKERYAPWSGAPMTGRIDLNWNGRDITIERRTKGRAIFADFRAYETVSGVALPELTAANCGQMLLGVEREVFIRAGFIRLENMPVTQDEALRSRLNALVTTGDESGAGELLGKRLKELKNRIRFNRTGLLPQTQAQVKLLEDRLAQTADLQAQLHRISDAQEQLAKQRSKLENHRDALAYQAAQQRRQRAAALQVRRDEASQKQAALEIACASLPPREAAEEALTRLSLAQRELDAIYAQAPQHTQPPQPPITPAPFADIPAEDAAEQAQKDAAQYEKLHAHIRPVFPWWVIGLAILAAGGALLLAKQLQPGLIVTAAGAAVTVLTLIVTLCLSGRKRKFSKLTKALQAKYGSIPAHRWITLAQDYQRALQEHEAALSGLTQSRLLWRESVAAARECLSHVTGQQEAWQFEAQMRHILSQWAALDAVGEELAGLDAMLQTLSLPESSLPAPRFADTLTWSADQTEQLLAENAAQRQQLLLQKGHCMGQMEQLGQESELQRELDALRKRLRQLEDTYAALDLAQQTLSQATRELQRRFAPQITHRAQELLSRLTAGRYDRLSLTEDFRLNAAATQEDTLHAAQWRSEGTVDQLYLALRLAVSEALTPNAPLILDDALVRFDDSRLAAAMEILQEEAEQKQVILFTCQTREKNFLSSF